MSRGRVALRSQLAGPGALRQSRTRPPRAPRAGCRRRASPVASRGSRRRSRARRGRPRDAELFVPHEVRAALLVDAQRVDAAALHDDADAERLVGRPAGTRRRPTPPAPTTALRHRPSFASSRGPAARLSRTERARADDESEAQQGLLLGRPILCAFGVVKTSSVWASILRLGPNQSNPRRIICHVRHAPAARRAAARPLKLVPQRPAPARPRPPARSRRCAPLKLVPSGPHAGLHLRHHAQHYRGHPPRRRARRGVADDALAAMSHAGYCAENGADVDVNEQGEGTMPRGAPTRATSFWVHGVRVR